MPSYSICNFNGSPFWWSVCTVLLDDEILLQSGHSILVLSFEVAAAITSDIDSQIAGDNSNDQDFKEMFEAGINPLKISEEFDHSKLNNLVCDLYLSKESAELLASRLHEKNLLRKGTQITFLLEHR